MKQTFSRRSRRRTASSKENNPFKREAVHEHTFFSGPAHDSFFQPSVAVQRKCEKCEKEEKEVNRKEEKEKKEEEKVHKKEAGSVSSAANTTAGIANAVSDGGSALPSSLQQFFSQHLHYDFRDVKLHTGATAAQSANDIHAQAYTYGSHIVFSQGKYQPDTEEGKKLLAHELTHVKQQGGVQRKAVQMKSEAAVPAAEAPAAETPAKEKEAEKAEEAATGPVSLPAMTTIGKASKETVFAQSVKFTGKTDADFDGGTGQTKNLKAMPSKDCEGCTPSDCMTVTGILEVTYHVNTTVTLPDVPEGLTPCQGKRVKDSIDNKIAPHEQQHVSAFNTYNGKVNLPINYTGCRSGLDVYLQNLHDTDGATRKAAAQAKSDALDPFFVNVDLDCKEPEPPKK